MVTSKGIPADIKSWKSKGTNFPLESVEGAQPYRHLDFGSVKLILDFQPSEL